MGKRTLTHVQNDFATAHVPAVNTKATVTIAAPEANKKNVCTGFTVMLVGGASAPAAVEVSVSLLDGSTVKWGAVLALAAIAGASIGIVRDNLWIEGSAGTAMKLEFSAAGGANTYESVSIEGAVI